MKKGCKLLMAFVIGSTVILNGCLSLFGMSGSTNNTATALVYAQDWEIGEFTDRWGEKNGEKYLAYVKNIRGVYSNRTVNNSPLTVDSFTFSTSYISFDLLENGNQFTSLGMGITSSTVSVTMRTRNLGEKTFTGGIASNSAKTVMVNLNEDIKNILLSEEEINFRITIANRAMGEVYYQFTFKPNNFKAAYESMNSTK